MRQKVIILITLLMLVFGAACSDVQAAEVDVAVSDTAVTASEGSTIESSEQYPQTVLTDDAGTDHERAETAAAEEVEEEITRPEGWSEETHSKAVDPNYEVVFPEDEVNTMTISIDPEEWQAMLDDMTATYGEPGSGSLPGGGPGGAGRGGPGGKPVEPGQGEPSMAGPGASDFTTENPIWVAADIEFEGDVWTDVGVRFKGNSSLMNAWSSGSLELPFKLDFDQFEDENPTIDDQRFYGFKQLSLSNNFDDATFMRDAVTADIMAEAGIAAAETAFYELHVDYGEGPVNFGLYTMIEVIDDTVIERVFEADEMVQKYLEIADLIEPYATDKIGADAFSQAVQTLIEHTYDRAAETERFLAEVGQ